MATEKLGLAEANVLREKGLAEASFLREKTNIENDGIRAKYLSESEGLEKKAAAMKEMDGVGREHEEFRLRLESERTVELKEIEARQSVAAAQASVLSDALRNARIDIVGGDGVFFDRIANAISMGKSVDGFVGRSDTVSSVLGDYTNGSRSLVEDIKDVLTRSSLTAADLQNMSVAAFLTMLMANSNGEDRARLAKLTETAKKLGVDELKP